MSSLTEVNNPRPPLLVLDETSMSALSPTSDPRLSFKPIPTSEPTPSNIMRSNSPTFPTSCTPPATMRRHPPPLTACPPRRSNILRPGILRPKPKQPPPAPRSSCRSPCPFTDDAPNGLLKPKAVPPQNRMLRFMRPASRQPFRSVPQLLNKSKTKSAPVSPSTTPFSSPTAASSSTPATATSKPSVFSPAHAVDVNITPSHSNLSFSLSHSQSQSTDKSSIPRDGSSIRDVSWARDLTINSVSTVEIEDFPSSINPEENVKQVSMNSEQGEGTSKEPNQNKAPPLNAQTESPSELKSSQSNLVQLSPFSTPNSNTDPKVNSSSTANHQPMAVSQAVSKSQPDASPHEERVAEKTSAPPPLPLAIATLSAASDSFDESPEQACLSLHAMTSLDRHFDSEDEHDDDQNQFDSKSINWLMNTSSFDEPEGHEERHFGKIFDCDEENDPQYADRDDDVEEDGDEEKSEVEGALNDCSKPKQIYDRLISRHSSKGVSRSWNILPNELRSYDSAPTYQMKLKLPKLGMFKRYNRDEDDGLNTAVQSPTKDGGLFGVENGLGNDCAVDAAIRSRQAMDVVLDVYIQVTYGPGTGSGSHDESGRLSNGVVTNRQSRRATAAMHKYLQSSSTIAEAAIRILLLIDIPPAYSQMTPSTWGTSPSSSLHRLNQHRFVLASLIVSCPAPSIILRRLRTRSVVFSFLERVAFFHEDMHHSRPGKINPDPQFGHGPDPDLIWRTAMIVNALQTALKNQPQATAEALASKSGLLRTITSRLIAVPGVVELLTRLVAADALVRGPEADDDSGHLNNIANSSSIGMGDASTNQLGMDFDNGNGNPSSSSSLLQSYIPACGAANPAGILLLANEGVCDSLVQTFVDGCEELTRPQQQASSSTFQSHLSPLPQSTTSILPVSGSSAQWVRVTNAARALGDVCIRSAIVPRFNRANCSFNARYTRSLNTALGSLSLFVKPTHIRKILTSALRMAGDDTQMADVSLQSGQCAWAGLSLVGRVLRIIRNCTRAGAPAALRRTLRATTNVTPFEAEVVAQLPQIICCVAQVNYPGFARARIAACDLIATLSSSPEEKSRNALVDVNAASVLMYAALGSNSKVNGGRNGGSAMDWPALEGGTECGFTPFHAAVVDCAKACASAVNDIDAYRDREGSGEKDRVTKDESATDVELIGTWICSIVQLFSADHDGEYRIGKGFVFQTICALAPAWPRVRQAVVEGNVLCSDGEQVMDKLVKQVVNDMRVETAPCGGPKPAEGQKNCLLANVKSLVSRLDDVDAV